MKKGILLIVRLALVIIFTLVGCSNDKNDKAKIEEAVNLENKNIVYLMSGKVQVDESQNIASKITSRILNINVDIGSIVNKGDKVIELDSKSLQAQAAQAQADVDVAQANLDKAKSSARPEQIDKDKANIESAKINYENTKTTYERNKELFDSDAISKAQLEASESSLATLEAAYKTAQATLDMDSNGDSAESIAALEAQVKKAQAVLATQQVSLQDGLIASPISGVVTSKNIKEGELAMAGTTLLTIVNLDTVFINAYVPSIYINKINLNQEVVIKISEIPDKEFIGEISVIDSAIDSQTKNILVKVKFKDKDPLLKPGMFAEIGIRE